MERIRKDWKGPGRTRKDQRGLERTREDWIGPGRTRKDQRGLKKNHEGLERTRKD